MGTGQSMEYLHPELNKEITSVSGHYILTREVRMPYKDREIFYYIGHAAFETSCCGEGGCVYAFVVGYINRWKVEKSKERNDISQIEKISKESDRKEISGILKEKEGVHQINFY
jgi:hypothetical protein